MIRKKNCWVCGRTYSEVMNEVDIEEEFSHVMVETAIGEILICSVCELIISALSGEMTDAILEEKV